MTGNRIATGFEEPLLGGQMTPGIVRIGDTVHRPMTEGAPFRHLLLKLLESRNYPYSPRVHGIDDRQREVLSYVEGEIVRNGSDYSDDDLAKVAHMLRGLHDATAGSDLCDGREIVCHNDIAPWNTVMSNGVPVAFIDFDAAEPGYRLDDIGYMLWTFVNLGTDTDMTRVLRRFERMLVAYGLPERTGLVDAILRQQRKVLNWRQHFATSAEDPVWRAQSAQRVKEIHGQISWVKLHRNDLEGATPQER